MYDQLNPPSDTHAHAVIPHASARTGDPAGPVAPTASARSALRPINHATFTPDPASWVGDWKRRTRTATLAHILDQVEAGEARGNLAAVADHSGAAHRGAFFTDSDVYKTLEALAWAATHPALDRSLIERGQALTDLLARVQEPDGYLNSRVQLSPALPRWSDPQWGHELYCAGHLFQAAVAAARTGTLTDVVPIATRFADLLVQLFGTAGTDYIDGHPEIETALVELYRLTGTSAYLELARSQLDARGHGWLGKDLFGSPYFLDHLPVRDATHATGHAVRQLYLLAGAVDVAVETDDSQLLDAVHRVWTDLFTTKTYITGAHGSRHRDESIGDAYELPPDRAYAETCAAIASFQLNWRLLLVTGDSRYADEMETALYNAIAVSTSTDGTAFFYSNPLQLREGHDGSHEDAPSDRLPWFTCACCPPNIARLLSSIEDYCITTTTAPADTLAGVQIHQYTAGQLTPPGLGRDISLDIVTDYPWHGAVKLQVADGGDQPWTLSLRIPAWCRTWRITDGDTRITQDDERATDGYVHLTRHWHGTNTVQLELDMPIRTLKADPRVDAVRGCLAVTRGPLVYALEQADTPHPIDKLAFTGTAREPDPSHELDPQGLRLIGEFLLRRDYGHGLYRDSAITPDTHETAIPVQVNLVPYHQWGNRGGGPMRVWLPRCERSDE